MSHQMCLCLVGLHEKVRTRISFSVAPSILHSHFKFIKRWIVKHLEDCTAHMSFKYVAGTESGKIMNISLKIE